MIWSKNMNWYKKAQTENVTANPLNGKSKQSARNYIYRLVGDLTKGFFRDNSWENVSAIWNKLDSNGINANIMGTEYFNNERGEPMGKRWDFAIDFVNNKEKQDIIKGMLTAHFAGSIQDPSDRYDISFIVF
jgi:hypothetical protein